MLGNKTLGFIGGGNMAEAVIAGLLAQSSLPASAIRASEPSESRRQFLQDNYELQTNASNLAVVRWAEIVVLAVKPQFLPTVLEEIATLDSAEIQKKLFISIAAGVSIDTMQAVLGPNVRVIRCMPNTPALVQAGATVLSPGPNATDSDLNFTDSLFRSVGTTYQLSEEKLDVVTGLSGGGPAYVFVLLESMADAGVKLGLPRKVALDLAAQTVYGSAKLLLETDGHPGQLKDMVTSPGGTTIAGIHALEKAGFRNAIIDAIEAATQRSIELGKKQ